MRKWRPRVGAWAILGGWGLMAPAFGQIGGYARPQTNPHPTIPPAINMVRNGNPLVGYFGVTRPQQDTNRQLQTLQQDFQLQQPWMQSAVVDPMQYQAQGQMQGNGYITGHPVTYFNTLHYFPNSRFSGGGAGGRGLFNQGPRGAMGVPVAPGLNQPRLP